MKPPKIRVKIKKKKINCATNFEFTKAPIAWELFLLSYYQHI